MNISNIDVKGVNYNVKDAFGRAITAEEFSSQVTYNVGDLCQYSGVLYKCLNGGSGEWSSNNWSQTMIVDQLSGGGEEEREIVYDENEVVKLRSFIENRDLSYYSADWEEVPDYTFDHVLTLQEVNFPNCSTIGSYAFAYCSSLQSVSFPNCSIIGSRAFYNCTSLQSIYLLSSSVCTLASVNVFYSTPISNSTYIGTFGSIYVPSSLVTAYKTATNWATYSSRITSYTG